MSQMVKNLPARQETEFRSLGWESLLGKVMATHYSILCLENPMDRGTWQTTMGLQSQTNTHFFLPPDFIARALGSHGEDLEQEREVVRLSKLCFRKIARVQEWRVTWDGVARRRW